MTFIAVPGVDEGDEGHQRGELVTLGTPGTDISDTGPVATKVLNWGFQHH